MRRLLLTTWMAIALLVSTAQLARAQTAVCDGLQGDKRQLAQEIMQAQKPYACCDGTIAECVAKRPRCVLARRLADDVCRRAGAGQDRAAIERALTKRAESMSRGGASVPIDLSRSTPVGEADGKVTVVAYVCGRCPYCSKLIPTIKRQIAEGVLKGKAKLYVKLFPIRSHAYSTESGKGALAAQELGKFWPFLDQLYAHFDDFDAAKIPDYAVAAGMDRAAFVNAFGDAAITTRLVDSKKEGIRNKVEATPTIFLNGYKYSGDLSAITFQDVVEEEFDRMTGKTTE
ncbi:MAG: DsbA family protein [Deltaproteobacteria bacterium]|nr:DsbA family protein [Deltaproteobacteria bacterium]